MMPMWMHHTPSRGSVIGMRLKLTVSRLIASSAAKTRIGQALKNCTSVSSNHARTLGNPLPTAM